MKSSRVVKIMSSVFKPQFFYLLTASYGASILIFLCPNSLISKMSYIIIPTL